MNLPGLFVTGTDTGVGKTRIASIIIKELGRHHHVGAIKPISSSGIKVDGGALVSPDAIELTKAIGRNVATDQVCPIVVEGDVAPSVSIRRNGLNVLLSDVATESRRLLDQWSRLAEVVVVEGAGGLLCPITMDATIADLAVILDYPLVVVARRGLGTLNHTLLTIEAARMRGLRIAGVILNGSEPTTNSAAEDTNADELAPRLGTIPLLSEVPYGGVASLGVDWYGLAKPPRRASSPLS